MHMHALPALDRLPASEDPTQALAHAEASSTCLPITVLPIPGEAERTADDHPQPCIFVAQRGQGMRWYRQGGRTRVMATAPRMVEMYERGLSFDHCRWQGEAGRCVGIAFADADVQAMTHGELQALPLRTHNELFDERISRIALELADEALCGFPNGTLYAQGLNVALLGVLAQGYTGAPPHAATAAPRRFGPLQQQRLVAFVAERLGGDVSLTRLADEVGLSVHHFVRVFKASFGVTPHRYVQEQRLQAAVRALREPRGRPIAVIAIECGFSSQAHLTALMRQRYGITPRGVRQQI